MTPAILQVKPELKEIIKDNQSSFKKLIVEKSFVGIKNVGGRKKYVLYKNC